MTNWIHCFCTASAFFEGQNCRYTVSYNHLIMRFTFQVRNFHKLLKKAGNTRAKEMKIPEETIAELSVGYEDCLSRLETRLKSKGRKG